MELFSRNEENGRCHTARFLQKSLHRLSSLHLVWGQKLLDHSVGLCHIDLGEFPLRLDNLCLPLVSGLVDHLDKIASHELRRVSQRIANRFLLR
jgi:hypothetical protein